MVPAQVTCKQRDLNFDFSKGQTLSGVNLTAHIGVVKNTTNSAIEFREQSCANFQTAAVAAWPKRLLLAGESAEVFVLTRNTQPQTAKPKRPSLLEASE